MTDTARPMPLQILRRGWAATLDLLLPPLCPACRAIVSGDGVFCTACWARLRFITAPMCSCCGVPFAFDPGVATRCGACQLEPPRFASARAPLVYDGAARAALLGLKNHGRQHLARYMAPAMIRAGSEMLAGDPLLVPVPLHRWRLWRRGFNQSALLAQAIARLTGSSLSVDALVRVRATPRSRGMGRGQRAANVRGVFKVARPAAIAGRKIVLVDDVLTTGATAQACARLLLRQGAKSVHVLTWARVVQSAEDVTY
ncbi:MAG: ComF family protein [Polymorphobacter sp.]